MPQVARPPPTPRTKRVADAGRTLFAAATKDQSGAPVEPLQAPPPARRTAYAATTPGARPAPPAFGAGGGAGASAGVQSGWRAPPPTPTVVHDNRT